MKILITDDDQDVRSLLRLTLEKYGDCTEASHGREAMSILFSAWKSGEPFELLLLDLDMPSINGMTVPKFMILSRTPACRWV